MIGHHTITKLSTFQCLDSPLLSCYEIIFQVSSWRLGHQPPSSAIAIGFHLRSIQAYASIPWLKIHSHIQPWFTFNRGDASERSLFNLASTCVYGRAWCMGRGEGPPACPHTCLGHQPWSFFQNMRLCMRNRNISETTMHAHSYLSISKQKNIYKRFEMTGVQTLDLWVIGIKRQWDMKL